VHQSRLVAKKFKNGSLFSNNIKKNKYIIIKNSKGKARKSNGRAISI
jgi:hypothetical protein